MSKIAYSAIVLNERSKQRLIKYFREIIPNEFNIFGNYMLINQGNINPLYEKYLGISVSLNVIDYHINENIFVVGVTGFYSENKKPYIILASKLNKNNISDFSNNWKSLKRPLKISGTVAEIEFNF